MYITEPPKIVMVEQYEGTRKKEVAVYSRRNRVKQVFFVGNKVFVVFKEDETK